MSIDDLLAEIKRLTAERDALGEQLDIAERALREYAAYDNWTKRNDRFEYRDEWMGGRHGYTLARVAMTHIAHA